MVRGYCFLLIVVVLLPLYVKAQNEPFLYDLQPISVENAPNLVRVASLGQSSPHAFSWSPDGSQVAVSFSGNPDVVHIYNTSDLIEPVEILPLSGATVFSPDGRFLASKSGAIWDFEEDRLHGDFLDDSINYYFYHQDFVFDPTSHYIFAAVEDQIQIWNVYGMGPQHPIQGDFSQLRVTPDETRIIGLSRDFDKSDIVIWSLPSREEVFRFVVDGRTQNFAIMPDGETVAITSDKRVRWFNLQSGQLLYEYEIQYLEAAYDIVVTDDGLTAYILGSHEFGIRVVALYLSVDRRVDNEAIVYHQRGWVPWGYDEDIGDIYLSSDERQLAINSDAQGFALLDLEKQQREYVFLNSMEYVRSLRFSPDEHYLAVGNGRANLHIWDLQTGSVEAVLWGDVENAEGVWFEGDDIYLIQMDYDGRSIGVWDVHQREKLFELQVDGYQSASFSYHPDSRIAAATHEDGGVTLWKVDLATQTITELERFTTDCAKSQFVDTAFSGNGQHLAAMVADFSTSCTAIWDISSPDTPPLLTGGYGYASLNHDGTRIVSGTFVVSDISDASAVNVLWDDYFFEHTIMDNDGVLGSAYNPPEDVLAGVGRFHRVRVFDAETGTRLAELEGAGGGIAFSPDNRLLAVGTNHWEVLLYGVRP